MSKTEQMNRWKYIVQFLRERKEKGASLDEIKNFLKKKDISLTDRTFDRDKKHIEEVLGAEIRYLRGLNAYIINNEELEQGEDNIFDNLLLIEAYRETKDKQDIMLFERRKARGLENLNGLIHAITHKNVISFNYQKFYDNNAQRRVVEPYALKEFRHRWYLLAKEHLPKDGNTIMKTFGLDRMSNLEIKSKSFKKEPYSPQKAFEHSFGIISPNGGDAQEIILSFDCEQGNYIKALPLHPSQKIISENDDEITFSLFVVPTYDFLQEILSYGSRVKIIQPESLRQTIKKEITKMLHALGN